MKKYLALILVVCLSLTLFAGCGKKAAKEPEFTPPEEYASVVQVTINPTVNLYLDADEVILAVEYVNKDAKDCYSEIEEELVGATLKEGVNKVIKTAEDDGYLAENKQVTIDVIEAKQAEEKLVILSEAKESAKTYMTEQKIEAEVVLTETAQKELDDKIAAEKAEADRLAAEKAEADRLAAEKAEADRIAAEKAKKNPKNNLKKDTEYRILFPGEDVVLLTGFHIEFKADGTYSYAMVPYLADEFGEGNYIIHNGIKYFEAGGGGGAGDYTLTDERIIMTGGLELTLTMTADGKLVVEKVTPEEDHFKVGDIIAIP